MRLSIVWGIWLKKFKEVVLVEKVLRSLFAKFDSKVRRKGGSAENHYDAASRNLNFFWDEKRRTIRYERSYIRSVSKWIKIISEGEDEVNFVKNLERGSGRFKGKLPFKCFSCGIVGHYTTRCPHNKGKMSNRSHYIHDKSNDSSNSDEDIRLLMAYENKNVEPE